SQIGGWRTLDVTCQYGFGVPCSNPGSCKMLMQSPLGAVVDVVDPVVELRDVSESSSSSLEPTTHAGATSTVVPKIKPKVGRKAFTSRSIARRPSPASAEAQNVPPVANCAAPPRA